MFYARGSRQVLVGKCLLPILTETQWAQHTEKGGGNLEFYALPHGLASSLQPRCGNRKFVFLLTEHSGVDSTQGLLSQEGMKNEFGTETLEILSPLCSAQGISPR